MSYVIVNDYTLRSIGNAIRKVGETDTMYLPSEMDDAILGLTNLPGGIANASGDCRFRYSGYAFGPLVDKLNINGTNITNAEGMFYNSSITEPKQIRLDFQSGTPIDASFMFAGCKDLKDAWPNIDINYFHPKSCRYMFANCNNMMIVPELGTVSTAYSKFGQITKTIDYETVNIDGTCEGMFIWCYSINTVGSGIMNGMYNVNGVGNFYKKMFMGCHTLSTISDIPVNTTAEITENQFEDMVRECVKLRKFVFQTSGGSPLKAKWSNQVIDLRDAGLAPIGFQGYINQYNSSIKGKDIEITDYDSFMKNYSSAYAWTTNSQFRLFTYERALATVKSLPDTSDYNDGALTNTIHIPFGTWRENGEQVTFADYDALKSIGNKKGWNVVMYGPYPYN